MNMRTGIAVLLGVLLGGASGTVTFERTWTFGGNNHAYCVEQTNDDGYVLIFTGHDSAHGQVGNVLKTDSLGDIEWCRQYHSPDHHGGSFQGVCATLDGGYIGAGDIAAQTISDAWAVKTDSVGDTLWTYVHVGPGLDYFRSVAPTQDGGCVLSGKLSEGSESGLALLKLSRHGEREWLRMYRPPGTFTWGGTVRETPDHGFIVNGVIEDDTSDLDDDYIVRTDSVGETLWTVRYRPEIPGYSGGLHGAGCVTADGGFAICGLAAMPDTHRSYVARFDSTGVNLWFRVLFDNGVLQDHMLTCVQSTPDRGFVVVGSQLGGSPKGIVLVRLDSLGDTLWTRLFSGLEPGAEDWGEWVVNTRDGGFAVSGIADYLPAYLIKTDSMGLVYSGVSEKVADLSRLAVLAARPNPFVACCRIVGHERDEFAIFDHSGRQVGVARGDRIGAGLPAGVYFVRMAQAQAQAQATVRIVKTR